MLRATVSRSVSQSVSQSWRQAPICGQRQDFCYCQIVAVFFDVGRPLTREDGSLTAVIVSGTCHLYLQFYLSALYKVICQRSGSLWIHMIYIFISDSSCVYVQ
jgi:hypothetical protein